jgi:molecular chaperone DnaK
MATLGIDLGTTRIKTAVLSTNGEPQVLTNRNGETCTLSVVYFNEDGSTLVGTEATNAALAYPERAVYDFKVDMGTDKSLYTAKDGTTYTAKDIAAILLKQVKADAKAKTGEPVKDVVITVPANYSNLQKQHTKEAAKMAGMKVILTPHEPTAGALGNRIYKMNKGITLVYDLGGGTFDVSIIRVQGNLFEVVTTEGIQKLGGRDFNARIQEHILNTFEKQHNYRPDSKQHAIFYQDLKGRVELLKISMSAQTQCSIALTCNGDVLTLTMTRDEFEACVNDLVEKTIVQTEQTLTDAGLSWAEIDAIYPIGSGSMMPIVIRSLEQTSGKKVTQLCEAHFAAALGAAIAARIEYGRQNRPFQVGSVTLPPVHYFTRDILSRAVGVAVINDERTIVCSEILSKETPIPSIQTQRFKLSEPRQTGVKIQILQGRESDPIDQCDCLGSFDLKDLPERPDVIERIEITFDIDGNGLLNASARDLVCNKKADLDIDVNHSTQAQGAAY